MSIALVLPVLSLALTRPVGWPELILVLPSQRFGIASSKLSMTRSYSQIHSTWLSIA